MESLAQLRTPPKNVAAQLMAVAGTGNPAKMLDVFAGIPEHTEAQHRLRERALGEAHLGKVFGGEGDGDHGRTFFR